MANPAGVRVGPLRADAAPWVERLARAGYAAKGIVYLLIGILAARAAFGAGGETTGGEGALRTLIDEPFGKILLGLLAAGLLAYALWRAYCALRDPEDHGSGIKAAAIRTGFAASAIIHAGLALEAFRLATGSGGSSGEGAEHWTSRALAAPAGPWLVGAVGVAIGLYGLNQLRRGLSGDIDKRLRLGSMDPDHRRMVHRLGRLGLAARGIVFGLIGFFAVRAAWQYDPSEAGGVDQALDWLAGKSWGNVVFAVVALGLAAYGLFQLVKARYRVISAY